MTNQEFEEYADYCRSLGLDNCPRLQVASETPCADNDNACNLRWFEAVGDCCQIKKPLDWGFYFGKSISRFSCVDFEYHI